MSTFVSCSKFFPSGRYLFFQFSWAGTVSQKGHKLLTFWPRTCTTFSQYTLGKTFLMANLDNYSNKFVNSKLFFYQTFRNWFQEKIGLIDVKGMGLSPPLWLSLSSCTIKDNFRAQNMFLVYSLQIWIPTWMLHWLIWFLTATYTLMVLRIAS